MNVSWTLRPFTNTFVIRSSHPHLIIHPVLTAWKYLSRFRFNLLWKC